MIPELRERRLRESLRKLAKFDCLPEADASELDAAYCYLRLVENRLQAIRDQQTHDLPSDPLDRTRLACAMGARDWAGLMASLDVHRQAVKRHFRAVVFRGAGESQGQAAPAGPAAAWARPDAPEAEELLRAAGFMDAAAAVEKLRALRASSTYRRMDEPGRQRLDALMPAVIASAAGHTEPQRALDGVLEVIEAIGRRSAYFALLNENPAALERLVGLCGMSTFLVRQLAAHPLLLDELLDTRVSQTAPDRAELSADLEARMAGIPPADVEGWLDALRNFQQAATFRVAVVDLNGALPLMRVSDRLTDIAELVLEAALEIAWRELAARHGQPRCGQRAARFAIVAYGKLGGLELGYGSDLDLVFLHDSEGQEACTDGAQPVENAVFFARLTRRLISILTMPTTSGKLYDVDIRLRPSGRSGLLVSSLAAFDRYQREDAWTWEHQALLRSRGVAGSPEVREAFEALRKHALADYVRRDKLRVDVLEMRERMRVELSPDKPGEFEIKQDRGGITDIEFMVQYLVLRDAHAHPALVTYSDNIRQLEALAREAILPGAAAEQLAETYRRYRQRLHRLSLAGVPGVVPDAEFAEERRFVTQQWAQIFG